MFFRAHPDTPGTRKTDDPLALTEEVFLPWGLVQSLHIWNMAQNGVMPFSGGYLEQPRAFQAMMELFNDRLARMYDLSEDEVEAKRADYAPELDVRTIEGDAPAVTSFDMFRRG